MTAHKRWEGGKMLLMMFPTCMPRAQRQHHHMQRMLCMNGEFKIANFAATVQELFSVLSIILFVCFVQILAN